MKYDYRCTSCDLEVVIEHGMKEAFKTTCPECGEETLKRVITAGPVIRKGDGWSSHEKSGRYHPKKGT